MQSTRLSDGDPPAVTKVIALLFICKKRRAWNKIHDKTAHGTILSPMPVIIRRELSHPSGSVRVRAQINIQVSYRLLIHLALGSIWSSKPPSITN